MEISASDFKDKMRIYLGEIKIEYDEKGCRYYSSHKEFPNVIGSGPTEEKAKKDLLEGLWQNFEFLTMNENLLEEEPKKQLNKFREILEKNNI